MHVLILTEHNLQAPRYGGALRVSSLSKQLLDQGVKVSVIRFRLPSEAPARVDGDPPVREVVVPRHYPLSPVAALTHLVSRAAEHLASTFARETSIDLVQSDPPWSALTGARLARKLAVPHLLLAQNCETALAAQFARTGPARRLPLIGPLVSNFNVGVLRWAEKRAIQTASLTLTPSDGDRREMAAVGIATGTVALLPNGTGVRRPSAAARLALRERLGLGPQAPAVVFVGRLDYPPNLDAVRAICSTIAPRCPDVAFLLVGWNPPALATPDNVRMIGPVEEVDGYLGAGDLSIVPITRGSGTRIKILDAWAAGLPVLSTSAGAAGLDYRPGRDIVIEDDIGRFPERIRELVRSPGRLAELRRGALQAAVPHRWEAIGRQYARSLRALVGEG